MHHMAKIIFILFQAGTSEINNKTGEIHHQCDKS